MIDGTMRMRTMVASTAIAIASPTPMALMITTLARANARKTATMIAAAPVISLPLFSRPIATAAWLSPVRLYSSWMRLINSTS